MNQNFYLFLIFLSFSISGCEKNTTEPDELSSKEQILTAKTWIYDEYFTNFNKSSAAVTYKIGKPNNLQNLSKNRISFKKDKTYFEINETGDTLKGFWQFLNNETQLEVRNITGTYISNVITLTNTSFIWHDSFRNSYAKMLPSDFNQFPSVSQNKLVEKKWIYTEYFTNFSENSTGLSFKKDKPNNFLDLSKNRVTFNADGTVSEIDENGNSVPGIWKFITAGTVSGIEVRNYTGVYQSLLIHLDDSILVWYNPVLNRYGKMAAVNIIDTPAVSARAKILCAKPWLYTEYFSNYLYPAAELTYKSDKNTNNPKNLARNRNTFRLDGTYNEIDQYGVSRNGIWEFLENETKLKVVNNLGTYVSDIIHLDSNNFIWNDPEMNTYGKMTGSPYQANYIVDISKLTGKTWIYYEYFRNYSTDYSSLVYKREKINNSLNLNPNTVVFNTDGTFNEINESGQVVNGTWDIINGSQIRTISLIGGTNIVRVIQLDDQNLIWHNPTVDTYGKNIVKVNN